MQYTQTSYYTHLQNLLPESNFNLDIFNGTEKPCKITCNMCGTHYTFTTASAIARRARRHCKNVCKNCENNDWTRRQINAEKKAKQLLLQKQTIQLVGPITSWAARTPVLWRCTKCNHEFLRSPQVMFTQHYLSCPWCETRPFEYTEEMIKTKAQELWGTEYSILNIDTHKNTNNTKRILVCHNTCNFKYSVSLWNFLHGQGCPKCKRSHGEFKVNKYLSNHNLSFQEQYVIDINNTHLKLDFYLNLNGHQFAIEYNGIQHYQPVEFFDGERGYTQQVYRDKLKEQYCIDNNIELIIIPYNDEHLINTEELAQRLYDAYPDRIKR